MRRPCVEPWAATLCALACLAISPSTAQEKAAPPADLRQLRATYAAQLDRIVKGSDAAVTNIQHQYVRSLTALERSFQEQGKLDPLLVVKTERERFAADPKVEDADMAAGPPELSALQANYRKAAEGLPIKRARDIVALAEQYRKSLTALQESLTKAGNLTAAIEVKSEAEAVDGRTEVTASRFTLADAEANAPPPTPPPAPATPPPPPAVAAKKATPAQPKKKYTGKTENYIRQRFNDLCGALIKQDMEKAVAFADPEVVQERGTEKVGAQLRSIIPFLKWTDSPSMKLAAGSVEIDDKEETATVIPRLFANNQWREMLATTWIQVDGDWFVKVEDRPRGDNDFRPVVPKRLRK